MAQTPILVDPITSTPAPAQADNANPAQTQTAPTAAAEELPEKYRGKSPVELIEMLENAQTTIGRQSNEVGTYRRLVEQLAEIKRAKDLGQERNDQPNNNEPAMPAVTADALLERPTESISSVVSALLKKELAPLRESQAQSRQDSEAERLASDFPDYVETVTTPEFLAWRDKSQSRREAAAAAAQGDYRAARRLLEDYADLQEARSLGSKPNTEQAQASAATTQPKANTGAAAARQVATETPGSSGAVTAKPIINQIDVVNLILKDPAKYRSAEYQAELKLAAKEGRIR